MNLLKMKYLLFYLITMLFTIGTQAKQNPIADLSGHWEINLSKSNFGKLDPTIATEITATTIFIEHTKDVILLQRLTNGQIPSLDTLSTSGEPFVTTDKVRGFIRTINLTPFKEGNGFKILSYYKDDGSNKFGKEKYRTEIYTISSDKKKIVLVRKLQLPIGEFEIKVVFDLLIPLEKPNKKPVKPGFNLTGNWLINRGLSNFGDMIPDSAISRMEIAQTNNSINIINLKIDGSKNEALELSFDETKQLIENKAIGGVYKFLKWEFDGRVMSIYGNQRRQKKDLYMLSADGKTLTVHRIHLSPIAFTVITVYNKIE